jgi:Virus neck protein
MPVNHYFNNYKSTGEQRLVEDLIVESIKMMGFDSYYLPNDNDQARDLLYGEDPVKKFQSAFPLEMYLSSDPLDYIGKKDFFSKFGLEIKDDVNVIVSRRSFQQRVPQNKFTRPREGDLVYIPFLNGTGELFEIKFAEQTKDFHMLGRPAPYFYELSLEKFKYSQEVIDTGIDEIDLVVTNNAYTLSLNIDNTSGTGLYAIKETVFQSSDSTFANATTYATVQSFIPSSNTLTVTNIAGVFVDGMPIIGQTSNAQYNLVTFDPLEDNSYSETYDNKTIDMSAQGIIDFSESNPFGNI